MIISIQGCPAGSSKMASSREGHVRRGTLVAHIGLLHNCHSFSSQDVLRGTLIAHITLISTDQSTKGTSPCHMGPTLVRRNGQHQDHCLNRIRCCLCRIPMTGLEELWLWFKDFYFLSFRSGGIGFRCVADVAWTSEELHSLIPFLWSVEEMFSIYLAMIFILFF